MTTPRRRPGARTKPEQPRVTKPRSVDADDEPASKTMRLQRFLSQAGLGSRRNCEEYVQSGRITIDGRDIHELGTTVDPDKQVVCLDGERIFAEPKRYYILNKPPGFLCTHRDPEGRPRAIDLVPQDGPRLFTVGRLDENSRGLLLITNDGELSNRLAHPRFQVERIYEVQVAGRPTKETLDSLVKGLHFTDGKFRIRSFRQRKVQKQSTFLEVTLTEGGNREIRRLFARVGHKVMRLTRIAFGPLKLGDLKEGRHRILTSRELAELRELLKGAPTLRPLRKRVTKRAGGSKSSGPKSARPTNSVNPRKTKPKHRAARKPSTRGRSGPKRSAKR